MDPRARLWRLLDDLNAAVASQTLPAGHPATVRMLVHVPHVPPPRLAGCLPLIVLALALRRWLLSRTTSITTASGWAATRWTS